MAYDNICKYLRDCFADQFSQWLLGQVLPLTEIQPSELSLEPIRADSVVLLQGEGLILHLEFQTDPKPDIPFRMADYCLRLQRRYPSSQIQIRQIVIYLRRTTSPLAYQTCYQRGSLRHEFEAIRIWDQDPEVLMAFPGLLPFVVLTQPDQAERQLRQVASQLEQIKDPRQRGDLAAATAVLGGITLDKETIKRVLGELSMRESVIYQEWRQEALREGRQEGILEGRQEGRQEGIQIGEQQGRLAAVPILVEMGLTLDQIAQRLELPLELVTNTFGAEAQDSGT